MAKWLQLRHNFSGTRTCVVQPKKEKKESKSGEGCPTQKSYDIKGIDIDSDQPNQLALNGFVFIRALAIWQIRRVNFCRTARFLKIIFIFIIHIYTRVRHRRRFPSARWKFYTNSGPLEVQTVLDLNVFGETSVCVVVPKQKLSETRQKYKKYIEYKNTCIEKQKKR